jgi:hypothetical protein
MPTNSRTAEQVRAEIENERERLAEAVEQLREGMGEAADVATKLRANLPLVGAAALAAGFFVAGGIGATARLIFRRGREGKRKARVGRFTFVDRG